MASRIVCVPFSAEFPSTNYPQLRVVNARPVLSFDPATQQTCQWTGIAPQGFTGTVTAVLTYIAAVNLGVVQFEVSLEAVTDGDATDLDAGDSFATVNTGSATVPGTAGYIDQLSITLTNADSIAAGDYFRLKVSRDADHASDTLADNLRLLCVELRDAA